MLSWLHVCLTPAQHQLAETTLHTIIMGTNVYWPVLDGYYHFDSARNITLDSGSVVDLKLLVITVVVIFILTT